MHPRLRCPGKTNAVNEVGARWRHSSYVGRTGRNPSCQVAVRYEVDAASGRVHLTARYAGATDAPTLPAFGLEWTLPKQYENLRFYGLGPEETYHDRLHGGKLGIFERTAAEDNAPYLVPSKVRNGVKMGDMKMVDSMLHDGLTDGMYGIHMGVTADNIAKKYSISREDQDAFAYASQQKAIAAIDSGRFQDEIVPVEVPGRKGSVTVFDTDEHPNRASTPEKLAKLRPAFTKDGTVTAGNASGINDGASFTIIASEDAVKKHNLTPLAEVIGIGQGGVDPRVMGLGPTPAILHALKYADLCIEDMELVELNEAFAAQSLGVIHELEEATGMDRNAFMEKTNVNGGAIALGHPVGASGNRILVSLLHEMQKRDLKIGLASLCIGGGQGAAVIIKRV